MSYIKKNHNVKKIYLANWMLKIIISILFSKNKEKFYLLFLKYWFINIINL